MSTSRLVSLLLLCSWSWPLGSSGGNRADLGTTRGAKRDPRVRGLDKLQSAIRGASSVNVDVDVDEALVDVFGVWESNCSGSRGADRATFLRQFATLVSGDRFLARDRLSTISLAVNEGRYLFLRCSCDSGMSAPESSVAELSAVEAGVCVCAALRGRFARRSRGEEVVDSSCLSAFLFRAPEAGCVVWVDIAVIDFRWLFVFCGCEI